MKKYLTNTNLKKGEFTDMTIEFPKNHAEYCDNRIIPGCKTIEFYSLDLD